MEYTIEQIAHDLANNELYLTIRVKSLTQQLEINTDFLRSISEPLPDEEQNFGGAIEAVLEDNELCMRRSS